MTKSSLSVKTKGRIPGNLLRLGRLAFWHPFKTSKAIWVERSNGLDSMVMGAAESLAKSRRNHLLADANLRATLLEREEAVSAPAIMLAVAKRNRTEIARLLANNSITIETKTTIMEALTPKQAGLVLKTAHKSIGGIESFRVRLLFISFFSTYHDIDHLARIANHTESWQSSLILYHIRSPQRVAQLLSSREMMAAVAAEYIKTAKFKLKIQILAQEEMTPAVIATILLSESLAPDKHSSARRDPAVDILVIWYRESPDSRPKLKEASELMLQRDPDRCQQMIERARLEDASHHVRSSFVLNELLQMPT